MQSRRISLLNSQRVFNANDKRTQRFFVRHVYDETLNARMSNSKWEGRTSRWQIIQNLFHLLNVVWNIDRPAESTLL